MSYRERQRLADIQAGIDAIRSHLQRSDLSDGLIYDAVRIWQPSKHLRGNARARIGDADGGLATAAGHGDLDTPAGIAVPDGVGQQIDELLAEPALVGPGCTCWRLAAARDSAHFEAAGGRSDGTVLRMAIAASVVRGAAGSPVLPDRA